MKTSMSLSAKIHIAYPFILPHQPRIWFLFNLLNGLDW